MPRNAKVLSMIVLAVLPASTSALDLQMGGTFTMDFVAGKPGPDLLGIVGHENSWAISLQDVQFICDETECFPGPGFNKIQNLLAASFSFEFTGPDATVLNEAVGQHFTHGGLYPYSAYFQVDKGVCFGGQHFVFYIFPADISDGVYMQVDGSAPAGTFPDDMSGCPTIGPFALNAIQAILFDRRAGYEGNLGATNAPTLFLQIPISVEDRSWGTIKAIYR